MFSWQQRKDFSLREKQVKRECCVKKGNRSRDVVRLSLSGFPVGNAFSLLFVRFVEFSGKNRLKYVSMFHRRIFSITRAVVARYGDVSCDLNSFSIGFRLVYLIF